MNNLLTLLDKKGISWRRASSAHGGEYHSACPGCGDGGKGRNSDRFHVWPEKTSGSGRTPGRFWCRQCGKNGDTIQFLIDFDRMNFREACAFLGIHLPDAKSFVSPQKFSTPKIPPALGNTHEPKIYDPPSALWSERATAFLADCHARLLDRPDALDWLAKRGIDLQAVKDYQLGYNESSQGKDRYRPMSRWGLAAEKSGKSREKKLWLPRGWVIPMFGSDGTVHQLRIRRRDEDIETFMPNIKYLVVKGSSLATMVLHPESLAHVVVESGFDAILIASRFEGKLGAVTTWNSAAKPDSRATAILQKSHCILNALDFDKAGTNEQDWWMRTFRRNKRWPVPVAKDPGEAFGKGVDIRSWILSGLPVGLARRMDSKPENEIKAEGTEQIQPEKTPEASEPVEAEVQHRILTLADGRECHITDSRELWNELTDAGMVVFSDLELERLQAACKTMSQTEREQAALLTVDFKEVFAGAYIRRGEAVA